MGTLGNFAHARQDQSKFGVGLINSFAEALCTPGRNIHGANHWCLAFGCFVYVCSQIGNFADERHNRVIDANRIVENDVAMDAPRGQISLAISHLINYFLLTEPKSCCFLISSCIFIILSP